MSIDNLIPLAPLLALAGTIVTVLLVSAFLKKHSLTLALTLVGLAAAFFALFFVPERSAATSLLIMDRYSVFYIGLIFASSFALAILSYIYLRTRPRSSNVNEYYLLLLLATLGSAVLASSSHFASFFLGLEILSVSLYALIAYERERPFCIEAGAKYLVLAGTSSAFLLFGMALIYASLGTMEFARIGQEIAARTDHDGLSAIGTALLLAGVGFKLALAPFHTWSPDVYEGAPAPVTAFVATVSKGSMFALLFRYFLMAEMGPSSWLFSAFSLLAISSMLIGNLLALRQDNIKRLLAYSSIAHLGYLLVALLAGGELGADAIAFYLASYFITTLIAFGVVTLVSGPGRDADRMKDYQGLLWRRPFIAVVFSASLLSLAGIPMTSGFIGKFYLLRAGISASLWTLALILALSSVVGLYYYLRVLLTMVGSQPESQQIQGTRLRLSPSGSVLLTVLSAALVWLGVYPSPVLNLIHYAMSSLPQ